MKLANWKQLKVRGDLVISPQTHEGQTYYVIKDPVTLRYFRLRPAEYAIYRMLDGNTSIEDIKLRLSKLGLQVEDGELQMFLKQLGAANFFENVLPNQSDSLYQMALLRRSRRSLWQQVKRILYIKLPLVDPDRVFDKVMPYLRFLWSKWAYASYIALFVFAVYAFLSKYQEARASFSDLLTVKGIFILSIVFIVEKVFHELGHGLTCKRFGGEVHELGILVLVLFPCMYCNISDAWIMEKRSRKLWISAAGIITELIIASLAAVVWWAAGPGPLKAMSYRLMVVAGVSSVLVNGNPLMKWDGYYILSDFLGMPNLRANSMRYMSQFFRKYVLGISAPGAGRFTRARLIQLVYGAIASAWLIWVMYKITRGMLGRFPALGVWILVTTLYGLILVPVVRIASWVARHRRGGAEVNLQRLALISAAVAGMAYFLFVYDYGYSVSAPCTIEPARRQMLSVSTGGVLAEMPWRQGDLIGEGEVVARLENPALETALKETELTVREYEVRIADAVSKSDFLALEVLSESRRKLEDRAEDIRQRLAALTVRAPFTGTVLTAQPQAQLGNFVRVGGRILEMGDLTAATVVIAVAERDLQYVERDAEASIILRSYPWRSFKAKVDGISPAPIVFLPSAMSGRAAGPVLVRPDIAMANVPLESLYAVTLRLVNDERRLHVGMVGKARVKSGDRHIYDIIYVRVRESIRRSFGV